jgi:hypothetical protein
MSDRRYRLLGFVVWNGGKWYLRRRARRARSRLPSSRLVVGVTVVGAGVIGVAVLARRGSGPAAVGSPMRPLHPN